MNETSKNPVHIFQKMMDVPFSYARKQLRNVCVYNFSLCTVDFVKEHFGIQMERQNIIYHYLSLFSTERTVH